MSRIPGWKTVAIETIAATEKWSLNGGPFGSKLVSSMYEADGIPVIRGCNLPANARFWDDDFVFVSTEKAGELKAHAAQPGDVIFTQRGTLGQVGQIPPEAKYSKYIISQSQMKLTVNRHLADPAYVYYTFRCPEVVADFVSRASSSGVPHVNLQTLREFSIQLPPISEQHRIATILGAYDDLIEVNRKRVALLEDMARGLFDEWFVRFRFPGHEAVPIIDTPKGKRPSTWTHVRLDDVLVLQRGYDLPTSARSPGQFFVISASGRHGVHSEAKARGPGVVTGRSGTIGKVHLVFEDHWPLNTTLYVKEFKRGGPAFAHQLLMHLDLASSSSGSAVPTLNRNHVHGLPVAVPSAEMLDRFENVAMAWLTLAHNIQRQNQILAASRDFVLPRLILGQLSVAAAERALEEAA